MKMFTFSRLNKLAAAALLLAAGSLPAHALQLDLYSDGTATSETVPIYANYADTKGTFTQLVYPADQLAPMAGQAIKGLKFQVSGTFGKEFNFPLDVALATVDFDAFSPNTPYDGTLTTVYSNILHCGTNDTEMVVEFESDYQYNGGNLLISFTFTEGTTYGTVKFKGVEAPEDHYTAITGYNYYGSTYKLGAQFYPTVTFDYGAPEPYKAKVSPESLTFKTLKVGATETKTIKVQNAGLNPFTISATGLDGTPFSVELPAGEIASKASEEITVTFAPTETGSQTATLTLDMGQAGSFDIALSGNAWQPEIVDGVIQIAERGEAENRYIPVDLYNNDAAGYGSQIIYPASELTRAVGKQISSISFVGVKPFGDTKNSYVTVSLGKTDSESYASSTPIDASTLTQVFSDEVTLNKTDSLYTVELTTPYIYDGGNLVFNIVTYAKGGYLQNYNYRGEETAATTALDISPYNNKAYNFLPWTIINYDTPVDYGYKLSANSIAFGTLKINTRGTQTIKLTNSGLNPLAISASGLEGTPFSATLPATELASGASMEIPVTFAPTDGGDYTATLTLNLGEAGIAEIAITGDVFVPQVVDGETSVFDFQNIDVPNVPINPTYIDTKGAGSQVIYPAETLTHMQGQLITGITYYLMPNKTASSDHTFNVSLKAGYHDTTEFSSSDYLTGLTEIYNGPVTFKAGSETLQITANQPFVYEGGNLVIEFCITQNSDYMSGIAFAGEAANINCAIVNTNNRYFSQNYPRTTFYHEEQPEYLAGVSTTAIEFGKVPAEAERSNTVLLTNAGKQPFTAAIAIDGSDVFSTTLSEVTLQSGERAEIPVSYKAAEGGNYQATLKISCGQAGDFTVDLTGNTPQVVDGIIEVADGEDAAQIPFNMGYIDTPNQGSQIIYPEEYLVRALNKGITSITFELSEQYTFTSDITNTIEAYLGSYPTTYFTYAQWAPVADQTKVFEGEVHFEQGKRTVTITLDMPYTYTGGNLILSLRVTQNQPKYINGITFRGVNTSDMTSLGTYTGAFSGSATSQRFIPYTSFTYDEPQEYSCQVSPTTIAYRMLKTNQTEVKTVTVLNTGANPIGITASGLEGTPFSAEVPEGTIATGEKAEVPVTFAPTEGGEFTATLTLDMGQAGTTEITLTGSGYEKVYVDGETTVFDFEGSYASTNIPLNTSWTDTEGTGSQVIYPASELTHMIGQQLTGLKYYINTENGTSSSVWFGLSVKVGYTDQTAFASSAFITTGLTEIYNNTLQIPAGSKEMEIPITEPFIYEGGNLVVELMVVSKGNYASMAFKGEKTDIKSSAYFYSDTAGNEEFYPMTTFYHEAPADDKAAVSTTEVDFGSVLAGDSLTKGITLKNIGMNSFTATMTVDGNGFSSCEPVEVAPKTNATIPVTFNPTAEGDYDATLSIDCGAAGSFTVALTGKSAASMGDMLQYVSYADGTQYTTVLPVNTAAESSVITTTQIIYPDYKISDVAGNYIYGILFPTDEQGFSADYSSEATVTLATYNATNFSQMELVEGDNSAEVFDNTLAATAGDTELRITFDTPYRYEDGNLLITIVNRNISAAGATNFKGVNAWNNNALVATTPVANTYAAFALTDESTTVSPEAFNPTMTILYSDIYTGIESIQLSGIAVKAAGDCIAFSLGENTDANIAVYNMAGTLVEAIGKANGTLTTRALGAGSYVVNITTATGSYNVKVAL